MCSITEWRWRPRQGHSSQGCLVPEKCIIDQRSNLDVFLVYSLLFWKDKMIINPLTTTLNGSCTLAETKLIYDVIVIPCNQSQTYQKLVPREQLQIPNISDVHNFRTL